VHCGMGGIVWFTFTSSPTATSWAREWEQIAGTATRQTGSREKCRGTSRGVFERLRVYVIVRDTQQCWGEKKR
jgi:hypothetical protein